MIFKTHTDVDKYLLDYREKYVNQKIYDGLNLIYYINPNITYSFFKRIYVATHFLNNLFKVTLDKTCNFRKYFINQTTSFNANLNTHIFSDIDSFVFVNSIITVNTNNRGYISNIKGELESKDLFHFDGKLNNIIIENNKICLNYIKSGPRYYVDEINYIHEDLKCYLSYQQTTFNDKFKTLKVYLYNGTKIRRDKTKNYKNYIHSKYNIKCSTYNSKIKKIISYIPHEIISSNNVCI